MSMEVNSNYAGYYNNTLSDNKKKESTQTAEVQSNTSESSKDTVQEYYERLCKKFPQISIHIMNANRVTNVGSLMMGNENKMVLNLSRNCLKKMENDPAFAEEIENKISGIPAAEKWLYAQRTIDGRKVLRNAAIINADGSMQATCKLTRVSDTNKSANILNMKNRTKNKLDKVQEKNLEKHREEAKRIEKAQKEKEDYTDKLLDEYSLAVYSSAVNTYDSMGYEIEDVTSVINKQI